MKNYFLTYGDSNFKYSKIHLCELAKNTGFFDNIISLSPKDLSPSFINNYREILAHDRGAGYWIWKHEIIFNLLKQINNGDVILYCDAGSTLNNNFVARKRMLEYFELISNSCNSFLRFETQKNYLEKNYTIKQIFDYFKVDIKSNVRNSTQLQAHAMFFKKDDTNLNFFEDYRGLLKANKYLISDKYNYGQKSGFIENRHDQSIFSVLGKIYNSYILENETEFHYENRLNLQYNFPIIAARAKNHGIKDKIKLTLFKKIYGKKTKFLK